MSIVKIEKLDHQGRGIAFINRIPIFIPNTLPNEVVDINLILTKKKYSLGEVNKYIETSEKRIEPICPYFNICGGCDLMHLNINNQLRYKEDKIKDIMAKFAHLKVNLIKPIISSDNVYYYRNKVTFQVFNNKIGFYSKKSNEIVEIDKCFLINPKMNTLLNRLREVNLMHVTKIVIKADDKIDDVMLVFYTSVASNYDEIIPLFKDTCTSVIEVTDKHEKVIYGKDIITYKLAEYSFNISATAFFQVNTNQCEKLYALVSKYANLTSNDIVLDLYCGAGTIGIYLSHLAKKVYGVEINPDAVLNAVTNAKINNVKNIEFLAGDVASIIKKNLIKPDVIIVDPPRKGLDIDTINKILSLKAKRVVYVSCDPITLARDLKLLAVGYEVLEITPVDIFANTEHVECVCKLVIIK